METKRLSSRRSLGHRSISRESSVRRRSSISRESIINGCEITNTELISSYKKNIHGLESLIKCFEEVLRRVEVIESELVITTRDSESKTLEITATTATLAKIKIDLEKCRRERDDVRSDLEQLRREKARIVQEFERERIEFREKESKDSREIFRLNEEFKKIEDERDVVIVERDRFRRDKERFAEEFELERVEFLEKETRITNESRKWKECFESEEEERKIVIVELEELREEKERILVEFEAERIEFRETEVRSSEEIRILEEKFERIEKERETLRIDLEETTVLLEKERERASSSARAITELREQIEVLKRSWKTTKEMEEKEHEEIEIVRKELRSVLSERDELEVKFFEAQSTIHQLQDEEAQRRSSEVSEELIKVKADLARSNECLEAYLPPTHLRGQKFSIDKVLYCGKVLEDTKVLKEILESANSGRIFKPTDRTCGGELHKSQKTFTVAYHVDGKGPLRYISVPEGGSVRFH